MWHLFIYKRDDKQNVKNYRPVSLLLIFGKIFECLIYNEMYTINNTHFYRKGPNISKEVLSKEILLLISFCQ